VEELNKYLSTLSEHHDMLVILNQPVAQADDLLGLVSDLANTRRCRGPTLLITTMLLYLSCAAYQIRRFIQGGQGIYDKFKGFDFSLSDKLQSHSKRSSWEIFDSLQWYLQ